ncbi:ABC transporter ATP-binding protein [Sporomusa malonica]|uniref:Sulfonate transport system ATP-binding protein n=1 Tax=Sporomusa malonica TaxID=112901 RepID=A0A1W1ZNK0_9FIRM|nr:ABC transporter ATP-binding protein [Sporomusa malonica]SMC50115.1 sulfonate transport system ATP-binding protein [Sporomusa malonica]
MMALTLSGVGKTYIIENKQVPAVSDISLTVETGRFVTIVGRSGCGKTTLLRLIAGLEPKSCGTMGFNPPNAKIGLVFQEPRLMPWLTVENNMAFALLQEQDHDQVQQTVQHYLKMLHLEDFRKAYPAQISGGMAQRTALGRALCYNPDIILMDEPLGALDAFTRASLQKELVNIFLLAKKTILFVTHDVDEAVLLGQQVIVMEGGRILRDFSVPLTYPRDTASKEFYEIRTQVLQAIMDR